MEFIGIIRLVKGKEVDMFVATCPEHNYYFKGKPPLTSGCRSCWEAFFISEWALAGAKTEDIDRLESAIRHIAEQDDKGQFDFKPEFKLEVQDESI